MEISYLGVRSTIIISWIMALPIKLIGIFNFIHGLHGA